MPLESQSIPELKFRYKYLFLMLGIFIVGLVLLIISQNITINSETENNAFWKLLCQQISTALLVGAITGSLYEYFLRKEFLDTSNMQTLAICNDIKKLGIEAEKRAEGITDFFSTSTEQKELGISHCYKEVDRFDFTEDIEDSKNLIIVLNDGRGWVGNYYQRFVNRFDKNDMETVVILMHPNSPAIGLHAAKVGATVEGIRMKIAETIRLLHRANEKQHHLKIIGHHFYNTMSIFISDSNAIMTPYFLSKVRRTPPVLTFEEAGRESFYTKLKQDIDALIVDCSDISYYTVGDGSKLIESETA